MRAVLYGALFLALVLPTPACAGGVATVEAVSHELLLATLYVQNAAEYDAATRMSYAAALAQLDAALADPRWTAAVEQEVTEAIGALPPAVILDVDETVLSNVAYQARLILDGGSYGSSTWLPWCEEAQATPIAGALEFCQAAAARGVAVFYVTNRRAVVDEATTRNLREVGFPLSDAEDWVLTRDERPDWTGDKTSRRAFVAERHRVIMAFGDNLGDFVAIEELDAAGRDAVVERHASWWGTRWFMIPNPMYGSWESELTKELPRDQRSPEQTLLHKRSLLDPARHD